MMSRKRRYEGQNTGNYFVEWASKLKAKMYATSSQNQMEVRFN
jgi:hypothetical protein